MHLQIVRLNLLFVMLLIGFLLTIPLGSKAQQNFYVSNDGVDDNNSSGSFEQPWATLNMVQSSIGSLIQSGDVVHFAAGDRFEGSISLSNWSGLTLTAYDPDNASADPSTIPPGSLPVFHGSKVVTGWTDTDMDGTWSAPFATQNGYVEYLYDDGQLQRKARFPNHDPATTNDWIFYDNADHVDPTPQSPSSGDEYIVITSDALTQGTVDYWLGAEVVVRSSNWSIDRLPVISSNGNTVTVSPIGDSGQLEGNQWGYFIQNHPSLLANDAIEWYYDNATNTLHYRPEDPQQAPDGIEIVLFDGNHHDGPQDERGLYFQYADDITIQYISFEHYTSGCVVFYDCEYMMVDYCLFQDAFSGINDNDDNASTVPPPVPGGGTENKFRYNTFTRIYDRCLETSSSDTQIIGNKFYDVAKEPGLGQNTWGYQAMISRGNDVLIEDNKLSDFGAAGFEINGSGIVQKNSITNGGKLLNDVGGIQIDKCNLLTINDNIIAGMGDHPANLEGVHPSYDAYHQITYGIYFGDQSIKNTTVTQNTVTGCDKGIHADHSTCSEAFTITDNTLFNNRVQLSITDYSNWQNDGGCGGTGDYCCQGIGGDNHVSSYNDNYGGNIMYCLSRDQHCMEQAHIWAGSYNGSEGFIDFGTYTTNYYFNPFSDLVIYEYTAEAAQYTPHKELAWSLERWQSEQQEDLGSFISPLKLKGYTINDTIESNKKWSFFRRDRGLELLFIQSTWNTCRKSSLTNN